MTVAYYALAEAVKGLQDQLPVGLHEVFEECLHGVSKGDMYVDDIQLPRWADQFICR